MADLLGGIPFGIDDLKASARNADGTLASVKQDIFGATSIDINTESDTQEARGDNRSRRKSRSNKMISGSVGLLQHDPAIYAVVGDGATATTGISPDAITTYEEPEAPGQNYYLLEAQAWDGTAATRLSVLNATTTSGPNIGWSTDSYSEPTFDFEGIGFGETGSEMLFTIAVYETGEEIGTSNPVTP